MGQREGRWRAEGFWKTEASELRFEATDMEEWYSKQRRAELQASKEAKSKVCFRYK